MVSHVELPFTSTRLAKTANVYANCYDLWCTGNTAYTSGYLGTVLRATTQ